MRTIFLVVFSVLLAGCTARYQQQSLITPSAQLEAGRPVIVAMPRNGSYGAKQYPESGKMAADAVRAAFARHTDAATLSVVCRDLACLQHSPDTRGSYLVVPDILHWEDRATEWSGIPDRLEIKLSVYDGETGRTLASSILAGKSKWATFGGDHPQDLLADSLKRYVEALYR